MKLYHFTTEQLYYKIQEQGLTEGKVPVFDRNTERPLGAIPEVQWLTTNKEWDQSWDTQELLDYSRTEVRLTVKIPHSNYSNLYAFSDLKKTNNKNMIYTLEWLGKFGDPTNWYVYRGKVKPQWIQGVKFKPETEKHYE